ncbi:hypothetical protein [Demequina capsici]|uniref:Uncharacterized protein n=1 Tax=Demequina capsici TaxID=3075620 RepID=A0AA96F3S0_9MICO|nr:hypothetical protein [Demequina sp. OYTSA14]WNM23451.1 hypothetical protein RN606_08730 [Demequina sp. OYTSA14]
MTDPDRTRQDDPTEPPGSKDDVPTPSSRVRRRLYGAAGALALVAVAAAGWALASRGEDQPSGSPSPTAAADCAAAGATPLELDTQVVQPGDPFCLVVEQRVELTVGAAALTEGDGLAMTLGTVDGVVLATADTTLGSDPVVTVTVAPGTYVGTVTALDGSEAPPFLVYTSTLQASDDASLTAGVAVPTLADCGDTVPEVTDSGTLDVDGSSPYLCLKVTSQTFLVAGAESHSDVTPDEGGPDLMLSVSQFDDDGVARVLQSNDDVFGYDPEVTIDVAPGEYLITASAWFDADPGSLTLYAGPAGTFMRTGAISTVIDGVTEADCDAAPQLAVGDEVTMEGETQYLCLDNPSQQRLVVQAATLADQDLVLEIVRFVDGQPVRVAWTDDSPYSTSLTDTDPLIDRVLPQGRLLIAVTTFFGGAAADYDLQVVPGSPR